MGRRSATLKAMQERYDREQPPDEYWMTEAEREELRRDMEYNDEARIDYAADMPKGDW